MNINSPLLLEQAIRDSNTVLYFSHDYLARVPCKNDQLVQTAQFAKAYNAERLIAVTPLENVNFNSESLTDSPVDSLTQAANKAM